MNFQTATPVQAQTITPFLEKRDLLVKSPTGTGKTCAFGIPIVQDINIFDKFPTTLVLCPTRELAMQISSVLKNLTQCKPGVRIATIYGGQHIQKQFSILRRHPQIIVATPGRLIDHIERKSIKLNNVNTVVLDEADRMLDMGFRDDIHNILSMVPKERQTVLFSATLSKSIMKIAADYQQNPEVIEIKPDFQAINTIKQYYSVVARDAKNETLLKLLNKRENELSLVFVNTKAIADKVSEYLISEGFRADSLHGDMRQQQRDRVMSKYRTGKLDVLVATDVAARGIDVDDINMVINYDIPQDSDSYVHRIGRTGRANKSGSAYTFIYKREFAILSKIKRETKSNIDVEESLNNLPLNNTFEKRKPNSRQKSKGLYEDKSRFKSSRSKPYNSKFVAKAN